MITLQEAIERLERQLALRQPEGIPLMVDRDSAIERAWGWVLFYNSKKYHETGDFRDMVVGQGPVLMLRDSGRILETGSALPAEVAIENFEATGDPWVGFGNDLEVHAAVDDADPVQGAKLLHRQTGMSLGDAKRGLDAVARGTTLHVATESVARAMELMLALRDLGYRARRLPAE